MRPREMAWSSFLSSTDFFYLVTGRFGTFRFGPFLNSQKGLAYMNNDFLPFFFFFYYRFYYNFNYVYENAYMYTMFLMKNIECILFFFFLLL